MMAKVAFFATASPPLTGASAKSIPLSSRRLASRLETEGRPVL
jgi:hypothetical protein